jgi:tRNA-dihydrouridine synthase A
MRGERLHDYTRHLHGLFAGRPGARAYRQTLACEAMRPGAGLDVLQKACVERSAKRPLGRPEGRPSLDGLRAAE